MTVGDRIRFTKNVKHRGQKFLNNELRTVISIDDSKITLDKGEIVRTGAGISAIKKHSVFIGAWDRRHRGPKVLDFYAGFCAHRATCLKADGKDIKILNLILGENSDGASETDPQKDLKT